ncbi:hypothetical protein FB451DRAFT_1192557 [Mycena latifolia]|nr:hypothetical protein FB451DRAFT_1192557 [Mycena latifolia]
MNARSGQMTKEESAQREPGISHSQSSECGQKPRAAGGLETDTGDVGRAGERRQDKMRPHGGAGSTIGTRRLVVVSRPQCLRRCRASARHVCAALLSVVDGAEKLAGTVEVLDAAATAEFDADAGTAEEEAGAEGDGRNDGKEMPVGFVAALRDSRRAPRWRGARHGGGKRRRVDRRADCACATRGGALALAGSRGLELDAAEMPSVRARVMRRSAGGRRIIRDHRYLPACGERGGRQTRDDKRRVLPHMRKSALAADAHVDPRLGCASAAPHHTGRDCGP